MCDEAAWVRAGCLQLKNMVLCTLLAIFQANLNEENLKIVILASDKSYGEFL